MIIIMRTTLHDRAPNTYYGQWLAGKAAVCCLRSPAIAHDELVASTGVVAFDVWHRNSPRNRAPLCWKFLCRPKTRSPGGSPGLSF
jgi:hypothetical protein